MCISALFQKITMRRKKVARENTSVSGGMEDGNSTATISLNYLHVKQTLPYMSLEYHKLYRSLNYVRPSQTFDFTIMVIPLTKKSLC